MQKYRYRSFGFIYESEVELPGVPPADLARPESGNPVVHIRRSRLPDSLPDSVDGGEFFGIKYETRPGQILINFPAVARYRVTEGCEIIVDADANVSLDEVRVCLMGSAFGALLHQRGMMPLHASAVRVGDGCVVFAGGSGAGKSTLATMCHEQGYEVVCDDLCPVSLVDEQVPAVWPGFPRLKVWSDSMAALGVSNAGFRPVINKIDKYELPVRCQEGSPLPLLRLYVLDASPPDRNPPFQLTPIADAERLETLLNNTYRYEFLKGLGLRETHFRTCLSVLRHVAVFRLTRAWDLARVRQVMEHLVQDFGQLAKHSLQ